MIRLGTTSYILPADIIPNIRYLAGKVSDIELVLFESQGMSNLPDAESVKVMKALAEEHHLTYTVHFPLDIYPGSFEGPVRRRAVDTLLRVVDLTRDLPVFSYVLHLTPEGFGEVPSVNVPLWLGQLEKSLGELLAGSGLEGRMFSCETLSYPFSIVLPLVEEFSTSVTLDIGHVWRMGYDAVPVADELLPLARVIHLHGVEGTHDHQSLLKGDRGQIGAFLKQLVRQDALDGMERVLTLEIFSEDDFSTSKELLLHSYHLDIL